MKYAKVVDDKLVYPEASEFRGIPNWNLNDVALRRHGYMPIKGEFTMGENYEAVPSSWSINIESREVMEKRQVTVDKLDENGKKIGETFAFKDVPVTKDVSYIQIESWDYWEKKPAPQPVIDDSDFKSACAMFRDVCRQIGAFIGEDDFKGGFEDYGKFINSTAAKSAKASASLLASMWNGANEYAKYEGSKLGYDQPEWWYKCWEYTDEELFGSSDSE